MSAASRVLFTSDEEERSLRVPAQSEAMGSNLLLTVAGFVDPGQGRVLLSLKTPGWEDPKGYMHGLDGILE